jgi:hypothetical protein
MEEVWENLNFYEMNPKTIKEAFELIFQIKPQFTTAKKLRIWNSIDFTQQTPHKIKNIYTNLFLTDRLY